MTDELKKIDQAIAELKTTRVDEIKELLFDAAVKVVAYEHLLKNKSKSQLPFPMPSAQAAEFRSRVDALLDGEEPIAVRSVELKEMRKRILQTV